MNTEPSEHDDEQSLIIEHVDVNGELVGVADTEILAQSMTELLFWMTDIDRGDAGTKWFKDQARTNPEMGTHSLVTIYSLGIDIFPRLLAALERRGIAPDDVRSIMKGEID